VIKEYSEHELQINAVTFPGGFTPRYVTKSKAWGGVGLWLAHDTKPHHSMGQWYSDGLTYELGDERTTTELCPLVIASGTAPEQCCFKVKRKELEAA